MIEQGVNQKIRDFMREIDEDFVKNYGRGNKGNKGFGPFRRRTKVKMLLNGIRSELKELLPSKLKNKRRVNNNWNEVRELVQDAEWLFALKHQNNNNINSTSINHKFQVDIDGYVVVYTDGACPGNGQRQAKAGVGVFFGDDHPLNVSKPLGRKDPVTNNVAEIKAVIEALKIVKRKGIMQIAIRTDSQYMINSTTKWIFNWLLNGWLKSNGEEVIHKKQYRQMLFAMEDMDIKWEYVRGHSHHDGNNMADQFAQKGAKKYIN